MNDIRKNHSGLWLAAAGALLLTAGSACAQSLAHYPAVVIKDAAKTTRAVAEGGARCVKATAHGAVKAVEKL